MEHDVDTGRLDDSTDFDVKLIETHYNLALGYLRLGELELATEAAQAADELRNWYRTVSRFQLLNRDEEVELAKRIEAGEVENGYTPDAEQARDQLVQANLRLVLPTVF